MPRPHWTRLAFILAPLVLSPSIGEAAPDAAIAPTDPLAQAAEQLARARGIAAWVELQELWSLWDQVDPAVLEATLAVVAEDRSRPPPVRARARYLQAQARRRRGDPLTAARWLDELGYVRRWMIVGPFDNEGRVGIGTQLAAELELGAAIVPGRAYAGKERAVRWREVPDRFPFGTFEPAAVIHPVEKVCVLATTFLRADGAARTPRVITAWLGVGGAFEAFYDDVSVLKDEAYRGFDADQWAVSLHLTEGVHRITIKACGDESPPMMSLRLADETGGGAAGVRVSATPSDSVEHETSGGGTAAKGKVRGPLQELSAAAAKGDPAAQELFARYLYTTDSDDRTTHQARDLASAAAAKSPTVDRLILAARLAEDRNQARRWLEQADALAPQEGPERQDVRLELARLARTGPSPRDAFAELDAILADDPTHLAAVLGRVALYNEAGLPRTALALLDEAVGAHPRARALWLARGGQLSQLGRTEEAEEAFAVAHGLRSTDPSWPLEQARLAARRGDRETALHYLERVLAMYPASAWVLTMVATELRALSLPDRALATLRTLLELSPDDPGSLRAVAQLEGELGNGEEQRRLLARALVIQPQDRATRQYLEHLEPTRPEPDEQYAWAPERYLEAATAAPTGHGRRTLRDLRVTTVHENGKASTFRQVVFQPLTEEAAALASQFGFYYEASREVVQLRGTRVHRADGRVDEAVEWGEAAANVPEISMYTSGRQFYIQLPRLEVGDVVELRWRVDDIAPRNEYADHFGQLEYLQALEPMSNVEYVLIAPTSRKLAIDVRHPTLQSETVVDGPNTIHRFWADDVPALRGEPAMPPYPEIAGFVHASTYDGWAEVAEWYWGLSKDKLELDDRTRQIVRDITADAKTTEEKVAAVYHWVTANTRYVALEFGIQGYEPRRAVQTVARGWGDCKDTATVIVAMLAELGIDATLVAVRTAGNGDIDTKVASLSLFDHAIAYVPELDLYLDGTTKLTGIRELPPGDQGIIGLRIDGGAGKLVRLPTAAPTADVRRRVIRGRLSADGGAELEATWTISGSAAPAWRSELEAEGTRRERVHRSLLAPLFPGFELDPGKSAVVAEVSDVERPAVLTGRGKVTRLGRAESGGFVIPLALAQPLAPDYASLDSRSYPVHIGTFGTRESVWELTLPPGLSVAQLPAPVEGATRFGRYSVTSRVEGQVVTVTARLEVAVRSVSPTDYAEWKAFCHAADRALAAPLVLSAGGGR